MDGKNNHDESGLNTLNTVIGTSEVANLSSLAELPTDVTSEKLTDKTQTRRQFFASLALLALPQEQSVQAQTVSGVTKGVEVTVKGPREIGGFLGGFLGLVGVVGHFAWMERKGQLSRQSALKHMGQAAVEGAIAIPVGVLAGTGIVANSEPVLTIEDGSNSKPKTTITSGTTSNPSAPTSKAGSTGNGNTQFTSTAANQTTSGNENKTPAAEKTAIPTATKAPAVTSAPNKEAITAQAETANKKVVKDKLENLKEEKAFKSSRLMTNLVNILLRQSENHSNPKELDKLIIYLRRFAERDNLDVKNRQSSEQPERGIYINISNAPGGEIALTIPYNSTSEDERKEAILTRLGQDVSKITDARQKQDIESFQDEVLSKVLKASATDMVLDYYFARYVQKNTSRNITEFKDVLNFSKPGEILDIEAVKVGVGLSVGIEKALENIYLIRGIYSKTVDTAYKIPGLKSRFEKVGFFQLKNNEASILEREAIVVVGSFLSLLAEQDYKNPGLVRYTGTELGDVRDLVKLAATDKIGFAKALVKKLLDPELFRLVENYIKD